MKRFYTLLFILFVMVSFFGCEKYCTCTAPGSNPKQIEISPGESCSDYSGDENGECQ